MACLVFARQIVAAYPEMKPMLGGVAEISWRWYARIGTSLTTRVGVRSSCTPPAQRRNRST
jgi:hypothetical protein